MYEELNIPQDENVVLSFGFRAREILPVLPSLEELARNYPIRYLVVANPESEIHWLRNVEKQYDFIDLQIKPLPRSELYTLLHAADALLIHRESSEKYFAVLSSSVYQTLGSGCPIIFHTGDNLFRNINAFHILVHEPCHSYAFKRHYSY